MNSDPYSHSAAEDTMQSMIVDLAETHHLHAILNP